jgi:polar amino acid transport system substrate-binding protein
MLRTSFELRRTALGLVSIALVCAGMAGGCGDDDSDSGAEPSASTAKVKPPASIASAGRITFCSDMTYPPQEFIENGQQVGSDIEIGKEIGRLMGVDVVHEQVGFDGIIAALLGKKCDAINSGTTDTPERRKQVAFVHYSKVGEQLMVRKGNPEGIQGLDDMSGRSIAVQVGTAPLDRLKAENEQLKAAGRGAIKIVTYQKDPDAANALRTNKVDAYISDATPIAYYIKQSPGDFETGGPQFEAHPLGIAIRKEDTELGRALEQAIDEMYRNGSMDRILKKWNIAGTALK